MTRLITLLALAFCATAEAQTVVIDQFYNFTNTGVPITTNAGGKWDAPNYSPMGGSVQPQQFVARVDYNLTVSSQISFNFRNNQGAQGSVSLDPRANVGPYSLNGPVQNMGVVGVQTPPVPVANGATVPVSYNQVNIPIVGSVTLPPFNPANQVAFNRIIIKPIVAGNAITLALTGGGSQTFNKSSSQVTNYTESFTLSGVVYVRYEFVPTTYSQICAGSGSAVLGVYGDRTPAGSVLGLTNLGPNAPAVFVRATATTPITPSGFCLSGPIRMSSSMSAANSAGQLIRPLEGAGPFMSGQTHYFQGWYRIPGPSTAFSNAVGVMFL